jgi:hypothetical protein
MYDLPHAKEVAVNHEEKSLKVCHLSVQINWVEMSIGGKVVESPRIVGWQSV